MSPQVALALTLTFGTPAPKPAEPVALTYPAAYREAVAAGKPLCVWVGVHCTLTRNQTPDVVHVDLDSFDGSKVPRVVCSVPDLVYGGLRRTGEVLAADVCASGIKSKVTQTTKPSTSSGIPELRNSPPRRTDCGCSSTRNCRCPSSSCDCANCFPVSRFRSEAPAPVVVPISTVSIRAVRASGC